MAAIRWVGTWNRDYSFSLDVRLAQSAQFHKNLGEALPLNELHCVEEVSSQ